MSDQRAAQDSGSSPQSVSWSDLNSSPGLGRRFSELQVGSPVAVGLIETKPVLSAIHIDINDLPIELIGEIIVKHSELEWYAPAVDGQVCRYWRAAVLSTARAWARIRMERVREFPSERAWRLWIAHAASAPLDVRILFLRGRTRDETALAYMLPALLRKADSIGSLEISGVRRTFFLTPFPRLRHLRIEGWSLAGDPYPCHGQLQVASMPALRSLALGDIPCQPFTTGAVPPLSELSLAHNNTWHLLVRHSHTALTSLSLWCCEPWPDYAAHPIEFPNLIFLSLFDVPSFKPYITSPRLQTLHEGSDSVSDSFPAPLSSLTEYGILLMAPLRDNHRFHVQSLHTEFPNLVRLSLRITMRDTRAFFEGLAIYPECLPNLRWLEAENYTDFFSEREITLLEYLLGIRNRAALSVPLKAWFWEPGKKREIPLWFADVRDYQL